MVRVLKGLALAVLVICVVLISAYGISRMRGPSAAEQQALRLLQPSSAPAGHNGFAQLWLLPYPVPPAAQQAVLAADLERQVSGSGVFTSTAQARWPRETLVKMPGLPRCGWKDQDCLARVRGDQGRYAAMVEGNAALSARVAAPGDADYVRSVFAPDPSMPLPAYQLLVAPQTAHALDFVRGHRREALQGVCRDLRTARMLLKQPDSLVGGMIWQAMLRGNAQLLAEMLAELPADAALPDGCAEALAPLPDGSAFCATVQREFAHMQAGIRHPAGKAQDAGRLPLGQAVFLDRDKTVARMALQLSWPCQAGGQAQLAADTPLARPLALGPDWDFSCIANPLGCKLANLESSSVDAYGHRAQDGMAYLRLISVLLWLRAHPQTGLEELPAALKYGRSLVLDRERGTLSMELFAPRDGQDRWEMPLPATRLREAR